jgi:hypothetical protein
MQEANTPLNSPKRKSQSDNEKRTLLKGRYQTFRVLFPEKSVCLRINLFPCPTKVGSYYWYFGYGFVKDVKYLFVQSDSQPFDIVLRALVEPSFREDKTFHVSSLEAKSVAPVEDPLCSLNANQLFRLCSGVHEAMTFGEPFSTNFVEHYSHHPFTRRCLASRRIETSEIRVNVVPCAINAPPASPSFYLTFDPRDEEAVFLLENFIGEDETRFRVTARIRDVSVLKNVVEIF